MVDFRPGFVRLKVYSGGRWVDRNYPVLAPPHFPGHRVHQADAGAVPGDAGRPGGVQPVPDGSPAPGGGWPDRIGEDIVLTWKLFQRGYRVYFEPLTVAFTEVPNAWRHFVRQRSRWARGFIEG
jgi:cellulose synthase/poly-beta-1,6-N-acetylglucosamine synthase-like glycosyltransferase